MIFFRKMQESIKQFFIGNKYTDFEYAYLEFKSGEIMGKKNYVVILSFFGALIYSAIFFFFVDSPVIIDVTQYKKLVIVFAIYSAISFYLEITDRKYGGYNYKLVRYLYSLFFSATLIFFGKGAKSGACRPLF